MASTKAPDVSSEIMDEALAKFAKASEDMKTLSKRAIELQNFQLKEFAEDKDAGEKELRDLTLDDLAFGLELTPNYLRQLSSKHANNPNFPQGIRSTNGRRLYTIDDLQAMIRFLSKDEPLESPKYRRMRIEAIGECVQVINVATFKGGSGKTTTVKHLAQHLALHGYRVLIIDLDAQASLTASEGKLPEHRYKVGGDFTKFMSQEPDDTGKIPTIAGAIEDTCWSNIKILPANLGLHTWENKESSRAVMRKDPASGVEVYESVELESSDDKISPILRLRMGLQDPELTDQFDIIILDTPPNLGLLSQNAILAATALITPLAPSMFDFASSGQFAALLSDIYKPTNMLPLMWEAAMYGMQIPDAPAFHKFLFTSTRSGANSASFQGMIRVALRREYMLENVALESTAVRTALDQKLSLYEASPQGVHGVARETHRRALDSFNAVNDEILALIRNEWARQRQEFKDKQNGQQVVLPIDSDVEV